jgi:hypothetical protein
MHTTTRQRLARPLAALAAAGCAALAAAAAASAAPPDTQISAAPKVHNQSDRIWAGYAAVKSGPYTAVGGQFALPAVSCTSPLGIIAIWVGLDGFKDLLPQVGVVYDCVDAKWFIAYQIAKQDPNANLVSTDSYPMTAGDVISLDVFEDRSTGSRGYRYEVGNETRPWRQLFSTVQTLTAANAGFVADSANWIVENPPRNHLALGWWIHKMPDFGKVRFDHCDASTAKADDASPGSSPALIKISLNDHSKGDYALNLNRAVALPGDLGTGSDGLAKNAFTVTWKSKK